MEQVIASVKETMTALNNPAQTVAANQMLVQFEQSKEAWQVLDALMRESPGSQHRFLASISMYSKVQRDLTTQLLPQQITSFTQSLVAHLIRLSQEPALDMNVCRYVCLSIAATAVQMNQDGIIQQILQWLNPILATTPRIVLELLIVLPEECRNRNVCVSAETRLLFAAQLNRSFNDVLEFLKYVKSTASADTNISHQILRCLERWLDNTEVEGAVFSSHEMFFYCLDALAVQPVFEQAVDTCIAIWRNCRCSDPIIIRALFPRVVALRSLWAETIRPFGATDINELEDQLNICRAICRLATETAESCLPIVVGDEDFGQMSLIGLLIECVGFRHDFTIARIPLQLFYSICRSIRFCKNPSSSSYSNGPEPGEDADFYGDRDHLSMSYASIAKFEAAFSALLEAVMTQAILPVEVINGSQTISDSEEDKRFELRDTISDCIEVNGSYKSLHAVCTHLQQEMQLGPAVRWQNVEALLLVAQCIGPFLTDSPESSAMFAQLISFVPSLPNLPGLAATVIDLIGKSSRWLKSNPACLGPLLRHLLSVLSNATLNERAAKSIMSIFKSCPTEQELPTAELFGIMTTLRQSNSLSLPADLYLIEGLCAVLSTPAHMQGFAELLSPIVGRLSMSLSKSTSDAVAVNADIDRITCALRNCELENAFITQVFRDIFPILQNALTIYNGENTCEKVCRCYKHVIKAANMEFLPLLPALLEHLTERFQIVPVSAFVYAVSVCISSFAQADNGAYVNHLYASVWKISGIFFAHLVSFESFEKKPDLVEEYYYLMTKVLQYCPLPFLDNPSSDTIIQAAVSALSLRHREAQKGAMLFCEKIVALPAQLSSKSSAVPQLEKARSLVIRYGPPIVQALFSSLTGQIPAYALDENNGSICDVLWNLNMLSPQALQEWTILCVGALPEHCKAIAQKLNLVENMTRLSKRDFCYLISDFERLCNSRR